MAHTEDAKTRRFRSLQAHMGYTKPGDMVVAEPSFRDTWKKRGWIQASSTGFYQVTEQGACVIAAG